METSPIATGLHAVAATIWVGGMFFAYMILRPALGYLEGPDRLRIWQEVFQHFFPWVGLPSSSCPPPDTGSSVVTPSNPL